MGDLQFTYKDAISHLDFKRDVNDISFQEFKGLDDPLIQEFTKDIDENNDAIELHLARTKAYKEMLILPLVKNTSVDGCFSLLKDEQKTFGGSKIFYLNENCTKILLLAVKGEIMNKLNMLITRMNKVNERITRRNTQIKKDNLELYDSLLKKKTELSKEDEVVYFINQHFKS